MIFVSILLAVAILGLLYVIWENTHFRTVKYEYRDPDVPKEMDGLRILQLSDLHGQSYGRDNCRLLAAIRDCDPDVIMVTGDLIDSTFTNTEKALDFAEELVKLAPVYYCTGNHEHRLEEKELKAFLAELSARGVQVLSDEAVPFYGGVLAGLQERSSRQTDALEKVLAEQDPKAFTLLLAHKPHFYDNYLQADLVLSGHAHGGQIRLPWIGGLIAPGQGWFPEYTRGFYHKEDTAMLISGGIGNSHRVPRVFNPPELVLLTLRSQ